MGQGKTGKPLWRQVFPDRFSQIMALFLAFYVLFLVSPVVGVRYMPGYGFGLSGWASVLVVVFGVLCAGVHLGTWYQRYWMVPKMAFMLSFIFVSEDLAVWTINYIATRQDPFTHGVRPGRGFEYGMAFYSLSLAFFLIFLFLKPALSSGEEIASAGEDGARQSGMSPGNEDRH